MPVECSAMPGSLIESELFGYERGAFTGAERTKKGLIESADGGTLFLDEIGDLGVELQTRLFRFVEERALRRLGGLATVKVDCRILCATNQDLPAKIKAGSFREELFYRLSVVTVKLPALRERPEDIPHPGALLSGAILAPIRQEPLRIAAVLRGADEGALAGQCAPVEERDGKAGGAASRRRARSGRVGRGFSANSNGGHESLRAPLEGGAGAVSGQL